MSNQLATTLELGADATGGSEVLHIGGSGFNNLGAIRTDGSLTWNGVVDLNSPCTGIQVSGVGSTLTLAGGLVASGGTSSFVKTGDGWLAVTGNQPSTDLAPGEVAEGTLRIRYSDGVDPLVVVPGATLELEGGINLEGGPITLGGTLTNVGGNNTFSGSVRLGAGAAVNVAAGNLTLSGALRNANSVTTCSGSTINVPGPLTKQGPGTLILSGTGINDYTGATTVSQGVLNIRKASALGDSSGATTVSSGAALELQGGVSVAAEALTLIGNGIGGAGALRNVSGNNTWSGTSRWRRRAPSAPRRAA